MIKSWAMLECYLPPDPNERPLFKHASTQIRDDGTRSGMRAGETVWVAQNDEWIAGMAWEWVEARTGVLMLSDPNSIVTNLALVDQDRRLVSDLKKIIALNELVHRLDWQAQVRSLLAAGPTALNGPGDQASRPSLSPHWGSALFHNPVRRVKAADPVLAHAAPVHQQANNATRINRAGLNRTRLSDADQSAASAQSRNELRRAA